MDALTQGARDEELVQGLLVVHFREYVGHDVREAHLAGKKDRSYLVTVGNGHLRVDVGPITSKKLDHGEAAAFNGEVCCVGPIVVHLLVDVDGALPLSCPVEFIQLFVFCFILFLLFHVVQFFV